MQLPSEFLLHSPSSKTIIEVSMQSLEAAGRHNPNDTVSPCAILWTDHDAQWGPIIPQLRRLVPQLLTFGEYLHRGWDDGADGAGSDQRNRLKMCHCVSQ